MIMEVNPIIEKVCNKYRIEPEDLANPGTGYTAARKEAIRRLRASGMNQQQIANLIGCHVQTVYYWLRPNRRKVMLAKSAAIYKTAAIVDHIGGPKQTRQQREEILKAYLEDKARGTALACSRGLSPLYAYKLANAMGVLPVRQPENANDKHL
jgi:DNA-binding CsgD family transcriptional regulator